MDIEATRDWQDASQPSGLRGRAGEWVPEPSKNRQVPGCPHSRVGLRAVLERLGERGTRVHPIFTLSASPTQTGHWPAGQPAHCGLCAVQAGELPYSRRPQPSAWVWQVEEVSLAPKYLSANKLILEVLLMLCPKRCYLVTGFTFRKPSRNIPARPAPPLICTYPWPAWRNAIRVQ